MSDDGRCPTCGRRGRRMDTRYRDDPERRTYVRSYAMGRRDALEGKVPREGRPDGYAQGYARGLASGRRIVSVAPVAE